LLSNSGSHVVQVGYAMNLAHVASARIPSPSLTTGRLVVGLKRKRGGHFVS